VEFRGRQSRWQAKLVIYVMSLVIPMALFSPEAIQTFKLVAAPVVLTHHDLASNNLGPITGVLAISTC
jgi:hypothetical protein